MKRGDGVVELTVPTHLCEISKGQALQGPCENLSMRQRLLLQVEQSFHGVPTLSILDGLRAVNLKLWDPESGKLVSFAGAHQAADRPATARVLRRDASSRTC